MQAKKRAFTIAQAMMIWIDLMKSCYIVKEKTNWGSKQQMKKINSLETSLLTSWAHSKEWRWMDSTMSISRRMERGCLLRLKSLKQIQSWMSIGINLWRIWSRNRSSKELRTKSRDRFRSLKKSSNSRISCWICRMIISRDFRSLKKRRDLLKMGK